MKLVGITFVFISTLLVGYRYSMQLDRGLGELEGFLKLIGFMKERVGCYLESVHAWRDDFSDRWLDRCGFTAALRGGATLKEAYEASLAELSLDEETRVLLDSFFTTFGRGYLNSEIKGLEAVEHRLLELVEKARTTVPKKKRVMKASLYAAALGVCVLVI